MTAGRPQDEGHPPGLEPDDPWPPVPLPSGPPAPPPPAFPPWLGLPGDDRSTVLPPWPDRMVAAPNKQAALTWVERLSLPLRHKRALLTSWGLYTGVPLSAGDFAYLSDFAAPKGPA